MKVVSINGSPKGKNSNTNVMIESLEKGMQENNSEIVNIYLSEKDIQYCKGCYSCWFKTPGKCVINDQMAELLDIIRDVDILVFGTPLYFNNISGMLKVFFDRMTAAGGDPHKKNSKGDSQKVKIILVANCGFPYKEQFAVISLWIKHIAKMMQSELVGEFYTTNGKVLTSPTEEQKQSREKYLQYLENCGRQYSVGNDLTIEQKELMKNSILEF